MIQADQVATAIRQVVTAAGDGHRGQYPCEYVDPDGNPSCLVGRVLDKLGAYLPDHNHRLNSRKVSTLVLEAMIPVDLPALDMLIRAQQLHDEGIVWGDIRDEITDQADVLREQVKG